jgi:hypothetical protein
MLCYYSGLIGSIFCAPTDIYPIVLSGINRLTFFFFFLLSPRLLYNQTGMQSINTSYETYLTYDL